MTPRGPTMNYCSHCGSDRLGFRIPEGDTLPRFVCAACGTIHYQNPKVVVGCLPVWEGQVLLCKRAIEPRHGLWTLPAGFLENGESLAAGAMRETLEEANARVTLDELYTVISLPQINQVYMMFRAGLDDLGFGPGTESLEVRLYDEADIPWEQLAFRTITRTLRNYFLDRREGAFPLRLSTLERRPPPPDLAGAA
jgi:ADP-ribose pyrophosphatase YjhB (NUDIX family)